LQMGRSGALVRGPIVLVADEAHQLFAPRTHPDDRSASVDAFHIIAREGRKYGITLCIATQRPRDIPDDVLSQVGTFVAHRLIGSTDRASIEMASGSLDAASLASLASLGPGEALLLGAGIRDSRRIKVLPPLTPPISFGPDYQRSWKRLPTKS
jgi:DNA helicase HerA-like ATPase